MQPVARLATAACRRVDAYYPQQLHGYDCGLFMLGALHVVQGLRLESEIIVRVALVAVEHRPIRPIRLVCS